jgi:arylsulfatase A-like enzyme
MRSYPWRYQIDDTGSYPNILGWHAVPPEQATLAERLLETGVCTGLVTDVWHYFKATMNFVRGFAGYDYLRGQEGDAVRTGPIAAVEPLLSRHLPDEVATPARSPGMVKYLLNVLDRKTEEDYFAPQVFRSAAQWLRDNRANTPFFLWIDSFTPHELWDPPMDFADRYFQQPGVRDFIYPQFVQRVRRLTEEEIARTKALYYGYTTFADKWIGRFLDTVGELGLWEDTLLIFTSDHGTGLMDKGQFGKSAERLHPYNTRLNLWIRHPDPRFHGRTCDAMAQNIDLAPTILRFMGVEHPPLDGVDLWPLATREGKTARDHVVTGWGPWASVRTPMWNLIVNTVQAGAQPQLFHTREDAEESQDMAADQPVVASDLLDRLQALLGQKLPVAYEHIPHTRQPHTFGRFVQHWTESNLAR